MDVRSPGLAEEGPVGRELVLEDESKLVLVGALLAVGRRVPGAAGIQCGCDISYRARLKGVPQVA